MKNKIFVAVLIVFVLIVARSIFGQSIMLSSNGQSIVLSSRPVPQEAAVQPVEPVTPEPVVLTPVVEAQDLSGEYVVVFTTSNCPPCNRVKEITIPELRRRKIHVREIADEAIAAQYGVTRFPVVMLARNKRELKRWSGFISAETICQSLTNSAQPIVQPVRVQPVRYIQWPGWGTIDLETYNRNCSCGMCQSILAEQQEYQRQLQLYNQQSRADPAYEASQEATPPAVADTLLKTMRLTSRDVLADLGCGDGRILIHAVLIFGCKGVGVEIDPEKAAEARASVLASGLSGSIQIITADALEFNPSQYAVTAITAHLYEPLLEKLVPQFRQAGVRVVASPYHQVPGLAMQQENGVWIHRRVAVQL